MKGDKRTLKVCVTGAAGQIAYSFLPQLCKGAVFPETRIRLSLLDITPALKAVEGVALELQDCSFPLLESVRCGDKAEEMFEGAEVIVMIGGQPRKKGMERKDLLHLNKAIFVDQAKALKTASPDVRCVIVANPANTNALILSHFAPHVKKDNVTCLTRLDHNRALGQIMSKAGCNEGDIEGVYVFGNHSLTQYPCINNIKVKGKPISEFASREWLEKDFIPRVQKRGGEILQVRGGSSVFSAANAVVDHLRDLFVGSQRVVSLGVHSEGHYDIPKGLWTSLPVRCLGNWKWEVVKDVPLSAYCKEKIAVTVKELEEEYYFFFSK